MSSHLPFTKKGLVVFHSPKKVKSTSVCQKGFSRLKFSKNGLVVFHVPKMVGHLLFTKTGLDVSHLPKILSKIMRSPSIQQNCEVVFHLPIRWGRLPFTQKCEVVFHLELTCFHANQKCEIHLPPRQRAPLQQNPWVFQQVLYKWSCRQEPNYCAGCVLACRLLGGFCSMNYSV